MRGGIVSLGYMKVIVIIMQVGLHDQLPTFFVGLTSCNSSRSTLCFHTFQNSHVKTAHVASRVPDVI